IPRNHGQRAVVPRLDQRDEHVQPVAVERLTLQLVQQLVFPKAAAVPAGEIQDVLHSCPFWIPRSTFSGVMGSSRCHTPVACAMACAMAGEGVLMTISPIDFAPNGPVCS